jgi:hypothetical protein
MVKRAAALFLSVLMLIIPCFLNAQSPTKIIEQARMDAVSDVNGCMWIGWGALLLYLGVGAAYIIVPNPPPARLMGKSPEYIQVYVLAYRRQARAKQVTNALVGCVGMIAVIGIWAFISEVTQGD